LGLALRVKKGNGRQVMFVWRNGVPVICTAWGYFPRNACDTHVLPTSLVSKVSDTELETARAKA